MPTIFTDEDVQKYTRWQRFKMYAKIRAGGSPSICGRRLRGQPKALQ